MIVEPEKYVEDFAKAVQIISPFMQSIMPRLTCTAPSVKSRTGKNRVVLNPSTPLDLIEYVLEV